MKFILVSLLVLSFSGFAQTDLSSKVKWSELSEKQKKVKEPTVIGHDGENIYVIRFILTKRYIEKYSLNSLTLIKSQPLELEHNKKELTLIDQLMFDNQPTLYSNLYDKKTKKTYFFVQTVNTNTLIVNKPVKVAERATESAKGFMSGYSASYRSKHASKMIGSENGELGLFWLGKHELAAEPKKNNPPLKTNEYNGVLFDADLKLKSEFEVKLPWNHFETTKSVLSNDGIYYILGHEYEYESSQKVLSNKMVKSGGADHLVIIDCESGEIETLDIKIEQMEIEMLTFNLLSTGGFQVTGLTSEEGRGVSGTFAITYDESFEEINNVVHQFEIDFITATWSDRSKKKLDKKNNKEDKKGIEKSKPVFYNYYIDHLIEKPDGSTIMLAEQYYVRVVNTTYTDSRGNRRTSTTYYFYYNDIIAVNFDSNGDFDWKTLVSKQQKSANDGGYYSSYFVVSNENEINIIYNDLASSIGNEVSSSTTGKNALRKNVIGVKISLDSEGGQKKSKLIEFTEELKMKLVPKVCTKVSNEIVFLYAKGKQGTKLGTIRLD